MTIKSPLLSLFALTLLCFSLYGRRMLTPLLLRRGPLNKPYTDISRCEPWRVNFWTGGYQRSATQSFDCNGCKVPLTTLFFNKSNFKVPEAFANNRAESRLNFLLQTSILGPQVKYDESGAVLGIDMQHCFNDCWRTGFRASIPVRSIKMRRCKSMGNGNSDLGGQTIDEFFGQKNETIDGTRVKSYAYRLDFLSKLLYTCEADCPGSDLKIVNYADTDFPPNNPITISNQDITEQSSTPVSALKNTDGTLPSGQWAIPQQQAQNLEPINAEGSNVPNGGRGRFASEENYTPLGENIPNQAMLFIVPSVAEENTTQEARVIQQHVNELLDCIDQTAEEVFEKCGITFKPQCIKGAGDLQTEFYLGHFFSPCLYLEGYTGIRWPTGKRVRDPQKVFRLPTGNNGHFEYKIGTQGIWKPCRWAAIRGDITGFFVLRKRECVASAFINANVKNIGTPVTADIRWNYYILHVNLLVTPPNCHGFGGVVGYENYLKSRDNLRFCRKTALDCLGNEEQLSSSVITRNTRAISHKVRGEAFVQALEWLQIFGGGCTVFAGENVPKTTEWHLGFNAYF